MPFVGWVTCVAPATCAAASWPLGHPEPLEGLGSCEVRWTRDGTPWPPRHMLLGSPFLGWGFHAHEASHLGKALAENPSGRVSPQAAHPSSLTLGTCVQDQSLRRYEAEPSRCPWPGSRHPQKVGTGLWLSCFQVPPDIYSGDWVWLGAFALKAQEWGHKKEIGGEQKNTISGS